MFDPADPDRPVKAFLQEYQILFGFSPEALDDASMQRDYISAGGAVNRLAGGAALGYENGDETIRAHTAMAGVVRPIFRVCAN
jgi:hypothetical protein